MSGLLAGFIGGLAKGGLDIINTEEAQQRKIEDEARREEATMRAEERRALAEQKRQETLQVLAEQREEKRRQRDAGDMIAASESAEKAVSDRGFEKFKSDLGQTDASPEELRKVYDAQYHDKTVGGFAGADRYDVKESEKAKERLTQLQRRGASSGLISSGYTDYKDTANRERQAEVDAFNVRKQESKEATDRARLDQQAIDSERRFNSTMARIEKSGSGGSSANTVQSVKENDRGEMVAIMRNGDTRNLGVRSATYNKRVADLVSTMEKNDPRFARLPAEAKREAAENRLNGSLVDDEKPASSASPVNQNDGQSSKQKKPPAIASIKGAPAGSSIGSYVEGKGWEVRSNGKLVGYAKD